MNATVRTLHATRPLHANRDYAGDHSSQPQQKKAFEPKGHDKTLDHAQRNGRSLRVTTLHGGVETGQLIRRDRYTVTLRQTSDTETVERTIFKHAIESFVVIQPVAAADFPNLSDDAA